MIDTPTFTEHVTDSRGTLVLGNGVPALVGEISAVDDHLQVWGHPADSRDTTPRLYAVPLHAVVYWAFDPED